MSSGLTGRAVVVGAGVVGATTALALRWRGWGVTLIDQGPIPNPDAATADLSKLVRPDYGRDALYRDLMIRARAGWLDWNARSSRPRYHETGLMVLRDEPLAEGTFEGDSLRSLAAIGLPVRPLTSRDWEHHRAWRPWTHGYVSEHAGWAESGAVLQEVVGWAREAGVDVAARTPLEGLVARGARVVGVKVGGHAQTMEADVVVLAAGAWTHLMVPELADRVRAVGQPVFHLRPEDPDLYRPPRFLPWAADISRTGWYGFPATDDGVVKIANHGPGTPVDPRGHRVVGDAWVERLRVFLREHLPSLADAPVVARRLCLYSDTFDGDFVIDHHPDRQGLVVACGGSGHLFKFAPVIGEHVADVVEGRGDVDRWRWRPLGDRRTEAARAG